MFSTPLSLIKKTMVLSKYHSYTTVIRDYLIAGSVGRNVGFGLFIIALLVKAFRTIS